MLKRIPKSDITLRPFKSYKEWIFKSGSADVNLFEAELVNFYVEANTTSNDLTFNKLSLYGQLRANYYTDVDNVITRTGRKTNTYTDNPIEQERYLENKAKVISIPQKFVGEGIKPGSVNLKITSDSSEVWNLTDDGYSNLLVNQSDVLNVSLLDFETGQFNFTNYRTGVPYSTSVDSNTWDVDSGAIRITSGGIDYDTILYSWDAEASPSLMYVKNLPFLDGSSALLYVGNVFYGQGIITITRAYDTLLNNDWNLTYKSTQTNYEYEFLLVVNEDEFNISTNPTSVVDNDIYEPFTDSYGKVRLTNPEPRPKYIRKRNILENGKVLDFRYTGSISASLEDKKYGGFDDWEISGSFDRTGSFLAPMITTIGLYDDDCTLLAVAKLATPIKSLPDIPINFIVRFDI
jgi:hypothetical protein